MEATVLAGLAHNPSVPWDVLTALWRDHPDETAAGLQARDDTPQALLEEMAVHSSARVRRAVAGNGRLSRESRLRLLDDPDWRVWFRVWSGRGRDLSDEVLSRLVTTMLDPPPDFPFTSIELFGELFEADWSRQIFVARHPDPRVRRQVASSTRRGHLDFLLDDPDPEVRALAAAAVADRERILQPGDLPVQHCHALWWLLLNWRLSRELIEQVLGGGDVEQVRAMVRNEWIPPDIVDRLSRWPDVEVRERVASHADLTPEQVERLAGDPAPGVRASIATRRHLPADLVAALAADPVEEVREAVALHAYVSDEDRAILSGDADLSPGEVARWARSENPRLRRLAARRADVPLALVPALASDPDPRVRAELARRHPAAPGDLLLDEYLESPRNVALLSSPAFPREGLARFAGHADPRARLLAARDPDADPAVVDRLTADPDQQVREAMAGCPRLPADRIVALLDDPDLAFHAAANPALPWRSVLGRR